MFTRFSLSGCSLELLRTGEQGIVIVCKTQDETILSKLILMGIITGIHITLKQDFPSFILNIDNIDFILDLERIRAIYVRIIENYIN